MEPKITGLRKGWRAQYIGPCDELDGDAIFWDVSKSPQELDIDHCSYISPTIPVKSPHVHYWELIPPAEFKLPDAVHSPAHYTGHPSGIECIQITEHMGFNLGNAMKYIWRCDLKHDAVEDLEKAKWYLEREISKRRKEMPASE